MTGPGPSLDASVRSDGSRCPVCGGWRAAELAEIRGIPLFCNRIFRTRAAALSAPRGDILLSGCLDCGHVFNRAYDPAALDYATEYENSLHFSGRYRIYAEETVCRLGARLGAGSKVVDIGSGRGDFLAMLCRHAGCAGTGYDPSQAGGTIVADGPVRVDLVGRPAEAADLAAADLVSCRHVLEHLANPMELLTDVALACRPGATLFLEVPNGLFTIDRLSIWDLIYEHVSYFTPASLCWALARAGFVSDGVHEAFGGQFLWAEAQRSDKAEPEPECGGLEASFSRYPARHAGILEEWRRRISIELAAGRRLAVWGAGSKGVMFLNLLDLKVGGGVEWAIDINPRKTGALIAGTGQEIVAPERLPEIRPDVLLVMNPEYRREIGDIVAGLGLDIPMILVCDGGPA
jgi:2-polyprenyl-3-methyl-5-hydroxy-6-metoxy-1,4-benzoquinol methylase